MRVFGSGPTPCDIAFIGSHPGPQEIREGEPFVGRTSRDFNNHLLPALGLRREEVYLTNLRSADPDTAPLDDKEYDEARLSEELIQAQPRLIVAIGAEATRRFLGNDADLDEVHGILWQDPQVLGRVIMPTAHIAAYTPELQSRVAYDFQQLHHAMYGDVTPRILWNDPFPSPTYLEITDVKWFAAALLCVRKLHIDTEGIGGAVWSLQFAIHPGTAYLVRVTSRDCLLVFFAWLLRERPTVVYHGSLHDFGIMRELLQSLGLDANKLYDVPFEDTQIMAYLLQLEPIGLKPNCVRHCNMRMQDYNEVLGDAQLMLSQDYLVKVFDIEQKRYRERQQEEFALINHTPLVDAEGVAKRTKDGRIRLRKTTILPSLPRTDLHKAALRVLGSGRPYSLWQDQREDILVAAYNLEVSE